MLRDSSSAPVSVRSLSTVALLALFALMLGAAPAVAKLPNIVLISVDTLRYDRISSHGYARPTTPEIDALLAGGTRFSQARVAEPLTAPSMVSKLTSMYPHEHGATRNGLKMRDRLLSLPRVLDKIGYQNAAFVGNWTLHDRMVGLGYHFDDYQEITTSRRYFGLFKSEASGDDLTAETLDWIETYLDERKRPKPFLAWVHYVDPHGPYKLHEDLAEKLGIPTRGKVADADRYDTEVAFTDRSIGRLLDGLAELVPNSEDLLIVFSADHGESLGEHDYWGHGRHLYDVNLRVPMGIVWRGHVKAGATIDALASNLDIAPTVLGLLGVPSPDNFRGHDWTSVLRGEAAPPSPGRVTRHQAHKGAVHGGKQAAREGGLLEVGLVGGGGKQVFRLKGKSHRVFDLETDPAEVDSRVELKAPPGEELAAWLETVEMGLEEVNKLPAPQLSEEDVEKLRSLGYLD